MPDKIVFPLFLALSLFAIAACGPATEIPLVDDPSAAVQTNETTGQSSDSTPDAADDTGADPSTYITSGVSITGMQALQWGTDAENCILPGIVITGANADLAPCGPLSEADGDQSVKPDASKEEASMPEETTPPDSTPSKPAQAQEQDDHAARMTALAVDDLSQRLGIPAADIEVREVRAVTWPDTSMGCPEPDMMYAQMLQEGLLIRLYANGKMYFYHSGGDQPPFLCEEGALLPPDARDALEFVPPPDSDIDKTD